MSKKDDSFYYDLDNFKQDVPDLKERDLVNLEKFYPTYFDRWRPEIIKGIREGKSHYEIVVAKVKAMDDKSRSKKSLQGLEGNISYKLRRAAFRVIYLRYREQGFPQKKAAKLARQDHWPDMAGDKKFTEQFRVNIKGCSLDKKE